MIVERIDALVAAACQLLDGIEDGTLKNGRGILRPHRAPETSPSVSGLSKELAPSVLSREQRDNLVHFLDGVVPILIPVIVKRAWIPP
jgi:hypothetical protein